MGGWRLESAPEEESVPEGESAPEGGSAPEGWRIKVLRAQPSQREGLRITLFI